MGQSESRYLNQQRFQLGRQQKQAHHKQNVIETFGNNVAKPER